MKINKETLKRRTAFFLFWSWHVIYGILAVFLILPYFVVPMFSSAWADDLPGHYILYSLLIIILPFVSIYLALRYFQSDFRLLMKYFYGFEMPLLFFLLVRIFTLREDGLAVHWLILNVALGLSAWLIFILYRTRHPQSHIPLEQDWRAIIGSTLILGLGVYFGSVFLIIQLPITVEFIVTVTEALWEITLDDVLFLLKLFINPWGWLSGVFLLFTFSLFLVLPLAMIYLYIGQFIRRLPSLLTPTRIALVVGIFLLNIGVLTYATQQPQQQVFSMLEGKQADQHALFEQRELIRSGLLNAYLARYRYISTRGLSQRIQYNYKKAFGLNDTLAALPQTVFNALISPFLYDGDNWQDAKRAEQHYEDFFDGAIQRQERDAIVKTMRHNWEIGIGNEAGLLDAVNHHVHLEHQNITIDEKPSFATITVEQTLRNLTYRPKETVLHFSLPEDAALTGVWLSDDLEKPLKYPFVLAPKGAAQAVYKAEVQRRIDPALLEQTGPFQYRLRVFPIPGRTGKELQGQPFYVRFSYQALPNTFGHWPMPAVLEKRNVFWDEQTKITLNGLKLDNSQTLDSFPTQARVSRVFANQQPLSFRTKDHQLFAVPRNLRAEMLPQHQQFAILIDGSYSMHKHYLAIQKALQQLDTAKVPYQSYFCQQDCRHYSQAQQPLFFGNSQTPDHLQAFSQLANHTDYDAVLVLTDTGSYELATDQSATSLQLTQPLWLVHLEDAIPYAYDDQLLDMLYQTRGGVAHSVLEALRRYQWFNNSQLLSKVAQPEGTQLISASDQYLWFAKPLMDVESSDTPTSAIATGHWLRYLISIMETDQLDNLDHIHDLAKAENVVSHYSSMLVLVNDRQKEALKQAEQQDDRFEREMETGKQQTTQPSDPFAVPAVPEPEEWALIIIVLMLLSYSLWQRQTQWS